MMRLRLKRIHHGQPVRGPSGTPHKDGSRHVRRKAQALLRRQKKALDKLNIMRAGELPVTDMTALMIIRLAYRAYKLGRLTSRQARCLGCRV